MKVKSLSGVWLFATPWTVCSLSGSSAHGILQARILEWVAISFSRGSSQLRIQPVSPALQADSLSPEPPVKPHLKKESNIFPNVRLWRWRARKQGWMHPGCCCCLKNRWWNQEPREERKRKGPPGSSSGGSVFTRPPGERAKGGVRRSALQIPASPGCCPALSPFCSFRRHFLRPWLSEESPHVWDVTGHALLQKRCHRERGLSGVMSTIMPPVPGDMRSPSTSCLAST